jgi:hypothetical protein
VSVPAVASLVGAPFALLLALVSYSFWKRNSRNVFCLAVLLLAVPPSAYAGWFLSGATNQVYLGVSGRSSVDPENSNWLTNREPIRLDDPLAISFYCRTGAIQVMTPLDSRFFIRFQMHDAIGAQIPVTPEGFRWGSDVERFPTAPGRSKRTRMVAMPVAGPDAAGLTNYSPGPVLPSAQQLFRMEKPGLYWLTLEVHMMKQEFKSDRDWIWVHIKIPPFTVPIEKPATATN